MAKDKLIKPTLDGRFWAMGNVVETLEEAFDRCDRKGNTTNYFLEVHEDEGGIVSDTGICGDRDYIRQIVGV